MVGLGGVDDQDLGCDGLCRGPAVGGDRDRVGVGQGNGCTGHAVLGFSARGAEVGAASGEPEYGVTGAAVSLTDTDTVAIAANGRATTQPVAPEILVIDPAETNHRWGRFTSHSAFVPIDLVPDAPVVGAIAPTTGASGTRSIGTK